MAKPVTKTVSKKSDTVETKPETRKALAHEIVLAPTTLNAAGMHAWGKFAGEADLGELITGLHDQVKQIQAGDMGSVEAMLYGQAMTLQTIFTNLARKAQVQEYLKQFQANLSLALKAQAQCRATLEALAEIKNPRPVSFVKQANISSGPQQVNNGTPGHNAHALAHAGQNTGRKNELLEHQHGNYLDTGAQGTAGGADTHLETVEAGPRATHA